jgi:magnesium-transporting ATPase (P-type)
MNYYSFSFLATFRIPLGSLLFLLFLAVSIVPSGLNQVLEIANNIASNIMLEGDRKDYYVNPNIIFFVSLKS